MPGWSNLTLVTDAKKKTAAYQRRWRKAKHDRLDAAGLCTRCGAARDDGRKECSSCRQKARAMDAKHRVLGNCQRCKSKAVRGQTRCHKCREVGRSKAKEYSRDAFQQVLNHYGRRCACCGEENRLFLTIDHINNDGHKHRSFDRGGAGAATFMTHVRKYGWPVDVQILCFNCNCGRHRNGGVCPHVSAAAREAS